MKEAYDVNTIYQIHGHKNFDVSKINPGDKQRIDELSTDFAKYVLSHFLKEIVPEESEDPLISGGNAGKIFKELVLNEYAEVMAKSKRFDLGISKLANKDLTLMKATNDPMVDISA